MTSTRPASERPPPQLPESDEDWKQLYTMTPVEAQERGFGNWDGGLFLLPWEWFSHIPMWFEVECINGGTSVWGSAMVRDDDSRKGHLAYGVRLGPSKV